LSVAVAVAELPFLLETPQPVVVVLAGRLLRIKLCLSLMVVTRSLSVRVGLAGVPVMVRQAHFQQLEVLLVQEAAGV
jgi:hypothetical protein